MTYLVGPKGQVVIPKELRAAFGLEPGDRVTFWRDGDHIAVQPLHSARALRGRFKEEPLVELLMQEKARDRQREDRDG